MPPWAASLTKYKEFIAIVAFFFTGWLYIENSFLKPRDLLAVVGQITTIEAEMARKSQLNLVKCALDKYMRLTQIQIQSNELDQKIRLDQSVSNSIAVAPSGAGSEDGLSTPLRVELVAKVNGVNRALSDLETLTAEMRTIRGALERQECAGG